MPDKRTEAPAVAEARASFRAALRTATDAARHQIKPGDRISRNRCGGLKSTFTFTHWDGEWMAGRTINDCAASNVYAVNGIPTTFGDQAAIESTGASLNVALAADRAARAPSSTPAWDGWSPDAEDDLPF